MVPIPTRWLAPRRFRRVGRWPRDHPLSADTVLATVLGIAGALCWVLLVRDSELRLAAPVAASSPGRAAVYGCAVLAHVAIALRRARPTPAFVAASVAATISLLLSAYFVLPSMPVFLVALYSYCAHGPRSAPVTGFVVGVVGTAAVSVGGITLAGGIGGEIAGDPWFHALVRVLPVMLCAWSLGTLRRVGLAYVAALRQRAERAEAEREERARRAVAEERARIAREMHDVVAHSLSVVISQANGGRYLARTDPRGAVSVLETISRTGSQALADTRGILRVLRDGDESGDRSPQPGLTELPELVDGVRGAGVPVAVGETGQRRELSRSAQLAVYRLVQEALTNSMKHAGDRVRVWIDFAWDTSAVRITVEDDGPGPRGHPPSHGLLGMRERLSVVGGTVRTGAAPSGGFLVTAELPYESQERV